jgi:hypothetical protein
MHNATTLAGIIEKSEASTIPPDDNWETASELWEERNLSYLPVVLPPENKKVLGILKQENLLTTYKLKIAQSPPIPASGFHGKRHLTFHR